ncbi:IS3 family transposase [Corallococcus sp. M34]|uniref:IS3 family transposase n=1 Tax=Citreicoccus inhibens TaxID=2849499 RepID=UPI001C24F9C4|nr:IS3 family transposase [Citreicoccus inhibens]
MGESFESVNAAKVKLFDYIEVFYNQHRIHSTIGYAAPAEVDRAAAESTCPRERLTPKVILT